MSNDGIRHPVAEEGTADRAPPISADEDSGIANLFRAVIEHLPDGVVVHRGGVILYINPEGVARLGYDRASELVGRSVAEIIHPDDRPAVASRIAQLVATGEPSERREERFLRRDGTVVHAEVVALQVVLDGEPAIVALSRDVTEQRKLQAQLAQADRLASMGMLAAGVAHEINNPLTYTLLNLERLVHELPAISAALTSLGTTLRVALGARGADDLLHEAGIDAALAQASVLEARAREAAEGARRVGKIAGDLKIFARVDSDDRAAVDVRILMDKALDIAANELRFRANVVRDYADVPNVDANAGRLSQVFLNLLVNAAHAMDEAQPRGHTLRVTIRRSDLEIRIEVADTGRGIPKEHLARLFDPFFTTKPSGMGAGLGLSICATIVHAHGGRIEVESDLASGSRFTVCLPETAERAPEEPHRRPLAPASVPSLRRARVLVVDDEKAIRTTLVALLSDSYDVVTADSGASAISLLKGDVAFDVVLCDLMMPDVSGIDLHDWMEAEAPTLAKRVVFMTGGAFTPRAIDFLGTTRRPRLDKPFTIAALETKIAELVV